MAKTKKQQVANDNGGGKVLAPWPIVDRYPTVVGSNLTLQYLSSVYRICTTGYRQQWVDVLNELIERDPFAYAVVAQRINAVAGARVEVVPAKTKPGSAEESLAKEIADHVADQIDQIPNRAQTFACIQWAIFYGVGGAEILWDRTSDGWSIDELSFVHSRRISYPSQDTWDVHIWDQGQVGALGSLGAYPTEGIYGLRVKDFPSKFIIHTPQLRGDYPTREGLGREIAFWLALKGMAIRGGAQWIERFAKPWVFAYYSTREDGKPRTANTEDIAAADNAMRALGVGSLAAAAIPDSIRLALEGPGAKATVTGEIPHIKFIEFIDRQIAICVLGNADLTQAGPNGARAATETRKEGTRELYRFDAGALGETLKRDVAAPIVRLNYTGNERLTPTVVLQVDERPDPVEIVEVATKLAAGGAPVDADATAERVGVALIPNPTKEPRRMAPLKPVTPFELDAGATAPPPTPPAVTPPETTDEEKTDEESVEK